MALDFTGATSDRVQCGSDNSLSFFNDLSAGAYWAWVWADAATSFRAFFQRRVDFNAFGQLIISSAPGLEFVIKRATVSQAIAADFSNFSAWGTGKWVFVAAVWDTGGADGDQKFFVGDRDTPPAEPSSYSLQRVGSGAVGDESSAIMKLCNNHNNNQAFPGDQATVAFEAVTLDAGQLARRWWFRRPGASKKGYWELGFNGTGTQPDWSGNGNAGTVTGASVVDHVPLGPAFGYDTTPTIAATAGLTDHALRAAFWPLPGLYVLPPVQDAWDTSEEMRMLAWLYPHAAGAVEKTITALLDAAIQKQNELKTSLLDAAIQKPDQTVTVSFDAALAALNITTTADLDGLLQAADIERTVLLDAILKALNVTRTADLDAAIQTLDLTSITDLDAILKALDVLKTVNLDAAIQKPDQTVTLDLDAILTIQVLKTANLDAILKALNVTKAANLDAILKALGVTSSAQLDACVQLLDLTRFVSLDAALQKSETRSVNLDAILKAVGLVQTSLLDAALSKVDQVESLNLDAILKIFGATEVAQLDAILKALDVTVTADLDAILKALGVTATANLDAILKALGVVRTANLDAALQKQNVTAITDLDAVLVSAVSVTIITMLDALLQKIGLTRTTGLSAHLELAETPLGYKPSWTHSYGTKKMLYFLAPHRTNI
jgi:hypothetical protein